MKTLRLRAILKSLGSTKIDTAPNEVIYQNQKGETIYLHLEQDTYAFNIKTHGRKRATMELFFNLNATPVKPRPTIRMFTGAFDKHDNPIYRGSQLTNGETTCTVAWSQEDNNWRAEQFPYNDFCYYELVGESA